MKINGRVERRRGEETEEQTKIDERRVEKEKSEDKIRREKKRKDEIG